MKRALVTGGHGFIGGHVLRFLKSRDYECWNHHRGTDLKQMLEEACPDVIVNCAAEIYDVTNMYEVNVNTVMQLLNWCNTSGSRMIHFGSSSEYGVHDTVTTEQHVLRPDNVYSATKAAATMLCQGSARQHNLDVVIMRLYSPFGPGEKPHRLFPRLWQAFEKNRPMKLVEGVHDFLHVDDVIMAIDAVLCSNDRIPGEIINVCSGIQHTNSQVLTYFEQYYGRRADVEFDAGTWSTPTVWCGNPSVLVNRYNWQPDFDLEDGVYRFVQNAYYE
jgi:nucleoside-diphosphate-sugar epimerase